MSHSPELLGRIVETLQNLFDCKDCPVEFTDKLNARGKYYFISKRIVICLNQSVLEIVECLCHEIAHFKQQKYGKLVCLGNDTWKYDGEFYENVPYKDQPWEHEANYYMKRMFDRFCEEAPVSLLRELQAS